jgi:hypothetical protein
MTRGRGRPLDPNNGKRHPMGIRTTKRIKEKVEAAAQKSGRSVAAEIEWRLEASFLEQTQGELVREALSELAMLRERLSDLTDRLAGVMVLRDGLTKITDRVADLAELAKTT